MWSSVLVFLSLPFLLCFAQNSLQSSQANDYFVGAVVNFAPQWNKRKSVESNVLTNAASYVQFINHGSFNMAAIVVFPAKGLTGTNAVFPIEIPDSQGNPCSSSEGWPKVLWFLSCAAQDWGVYLVVSLDVAANGSSQEVHLAFDRSGNIVARYYVGSQNYSYFDTDMGLRFTLVSQEELLLGDGPFCDFVKENNVSEIVAPMAVANRLPFLTGLQRQWSWSFSENKGLLAAGLVNWRKHMTGSGLYSGNAGPIEYGTDWGSRGMIMQAVPKQTNGTSPHLSHYWDLPLTEESAILNGGGWHWLGLKNGLRRLVKNTIWPAERETLSGYTIKLLQPSNDSAANESNRRFKSNFMLCHNQTCCNFNVTIIKRKATGVESLFMGADFGRRSYSAVATDEVQDLGTDGVYRVRRCALLSWKPRLAGIVGSLDVGANFPGRPNVLLGDGSLPRNGLFDFTRDGGSSALKLRLPMRPVLTAGLELIQRTRLPPTLPYEQTWTVDP